MPEETQQPTSAREWKGRERKRGVELPLPSGNVALVTNPGIEHFIRIGLIPNSLKSVIQRAIQGKDVQLEEMLETDKDIENFFELLDKVLVNVVIAPKVKAVPIDGETKESVPLADRDQDFIYPDEVDFDDKIFVFNFAVGGTKDLETFRSQQDTFMESVRPGKTVASTSE